MPRQQDVFTCVTPAGQRVDLRNPRPVDVLTCGKPDRKWYSPRAGNNSQKMWFRNDRGEGGPGPGRPWSRRVRKNFFIFRHAQHILQQQQDMLQIGHVLIALRTPDADGHRGAAGGDLQRRQARPQRRRAGAGGGDAAGGVSPPLPIRPNRGDGRTEGPRRRRDGDVWRPS